MGEAYSAALTALQTPGAVFLHQDTRLLIPDACTRMHEFLRRNPAALAGTLGSADPVLPWWAGTPVGGALGSPCPEPIHEPQRAAILDGIVLAEWMPASWEAIPGWHGYDAHRSLARDCWVHPALYCEHVPTTKSRDNLIDHTRTCRSLAARWGIRCAYD